MEEEWGGGKCRAGLAIQGRVHSRAGMICCVEVRRGPGRGMGEIM